MGIAALKAASRLLSEGLTKTPLPNAAAVYKNVIYQQVKGNRRTAPSAGPQKNKPNPPALTRKEYIQIGQAIKGALGAHGNLRGYKTIRSLALAIKGGKLPWSKNLNHPANIKLVEHLNKTMSGLLKPEKRYPSKYSDSQKFQRKYASLLLYKYVDRLTANPPKMTYKQLARVGKALESTRHIYRKTIGHNGLIPLTCSLRAQLNVKWRWYKLDSKVHRHLVAMLDRMMPSKLKPTIRFPISEGFRRAYSRWLLIEYVRHAKLKAPPAPLVTLSAKQRKLYLKHAVFPAVWRAGTTMVRKPVQARRYLIWAKYTSLQKLPPDLYTKLSRYSSKLLKRREFKAIRQQIADYRAQYCPSGREKIMGAVYKGAVWTATALADAKSAKQRAKPARVEAVPLTTQQKAIILAAIMESVNKHLRQVGKNRQFKNTEKLRKALRRNGWIWSRLTSGLNNKLTVSLGQLLLGKKLGKLPKQLSKLRRGTPKTLYNSAIFDKNIGYITVAKRTLPVITKPSTTPAVALKPLRLSGMALVSARIKLLRAWQANRMVHSNLPKYRDSKKLASYLKKHGSRLKKDEKKFLLSAFKNALNAGYLRSIKPKVKAPLKQDEFTKRVYASVLKAAEGASTTVAARPTPRPRPRPANNQIALQNGLIASVRKVYGAATSVSAAKTVLETQTWSTLKTLGIVGLIQKEFASLGYKREARSSYYAQLLVKKTLREWKSSSDTTHTPVTPARPAPRPVPRTSDKQGARQRLLVAAVRATYGASTTEVAAKTVLKTQKWSVLRQLGIATYIMKGFEKLGYRRASKNHYLARRLVKKTLSNWGQSSSTASNVTAPTRPVSSTVTPAQRKAYVRGALLKALKINGLANTPGEATAFARGQKWSTLVALKLHTPFIEALNADSRLGKWRPKNSRSQTRAARKLYQSLKR